MCGLTLFWFDRDDVRRGILHPLGPFTHKEELRGDDTLVFWSREVPEKYDRLVWRDPADGRWREHVVVKAEEVLGEPGCKVLARTSLCDLDAVFTEETRFIRTHVFEALTKIMGALYPRRWGIEADEEYGSIESLAYHVGGYEALRAIETEGTIEFEPRIAAGARGVTARAVCLADGGLGAWRGLRLEYARDLNWCRRTVLEADVYTRLYGYGAGVPVFDASGNFTGGYHRRLTMEDAVIDAYKHTYGKKYREDDEARKKWGIVAGAEKLHREGQVIFPDEDTPYGVYRRTELALRKLKEPRVIYEADASGLAGGCDAGLGDRVAVVDTSRSPAWRLRARVTGRERVLGDGAMRATLTIGTVTKYELAQMHAALGIVTGGENALVPPVPDA